MAYHVFLCSLLRYSYASELLGYTSSTCPADPDYAIGRCGHSPQVDVAAVIVEHEGGAVLSRLWVGLLQDHNSQCGCLYIAACRASSCKDSGVD
jgi:hypothetical protein